MQTTHSGQWMITLDLANLDKAMKLRGIQSYRNLATVAGISQAALYQATRTGHIRDTAIGKIARALHVYPHNICRWELR